MWNQTPASVKMVTSAQASPEDRGIENGRVKSAEDVALREAGMREY